MVDPTVVPYAQRDRVATNRIVLTTDTETELIEAGGVDVFRDLTFLMLTNESVTEVRVDIRDALAGTIRMSIDLPADGGSVPIPIPVPIPQAVANTAWTAELSAAVSSVYITAVTIDN